MTELVQDLAVELIFQVRVKRSAYIVITLFISQTPTRRARMGSKEVVWNRRDIILDFP